MLYNSCYKFIGVEGEKIINTFAYAHHLNGDAKFLLDSEYHATLCGAVKFGKHNACNTCGSGEFSCLIKGVLTCGGIKNEKGFSVCIGKMKDTSGYK